MEITRVREISGTIKRALKNDLQNPEKSLRVSNTAECFLTM